MPRNLRNHRGIFGNFAREIKAACYSSELGYDAVSNYIVGAMKKKLSDVVARQHLAQKLDDGSYQLANYRQFYLLILDLSFYFFTLHPTVSSSLRLSHSIVLVAEQLKANDKEGREIVTEYALRWTEQLVHSPTFSALFKRSTVVPVELLNVLLSIAQLSDDTTLGAQLLEAADIETEDCKYFQTIVRLFIYRNHPTFDEQRRAVITQAREKVTSSADLTSNSEDIHMLIDLLTCPFIPAIDRRNLLKEVWNKLKKTNNDLGDITNALATSLVEEFEENHWFVRWQGIDLLNMIEKKELSAVYA